MRSRLQIQDDPNANTSGKGEIGIFEGVRQAGKCTDLFDGADLASGVYLYQLRANSFMESRKLILVKYCP
jgi:hypothetical protein